MLKSAVSTGRAPEQPTSQLRLEVNPFQFSTRWLEGLPEMSPEHAPTSSTWSNSLSICAAMKDENLDDVIEWLQYHRCGLRGIWPKIARRVCTFEPANEARLIDQHIAT
jgi:hypothetical protein